jgi:hypothetical protein
MKETAMNRLMIGAFMLALGVIPASAQSLDDLNIQIHGYATQGFLYSTNNNWNTTTSNNGSPAWTEAVLNLTAQPTPKLRVGVQVRYFLLGNYGNAITLDWASADYKASEKFGVRFGKVKTPWGLFNEIQDIDPAYMWALLPQCVYPIANRSAYLTHYGGVLYGTLKLVPGLGKIEYRGWAGEGLYPGNDDYFVSFAEAGFTLPNDIKGPLYGAALHWRTPLNGLMVGASDLSDTNWSAAMNGAAGAQFGTYTLPGPETGTYSLAANSQPNYFAIYEKYRVMVAYEYFRSWGDILVTFPGEPNTELRNDNRAEYGMVTYKVTSKLMAGVYRSWNSDHQALPASIRFQNEWVYSGRYDFSDFLYMKAEEHFIDGTGLDYDTTSNTNLQPKTSLTALKISVTF